ncbi:hypothetical protein BU26DRAFT_568938 [Trematosphaeria pertusa]|uniref:Vacuolar protein sorting-associated protein 62 n=1 Tax=Trematosphaeria pertusa TaxID=390896 RepID=A0A6A6I3W5_9PLEO|nr:uncharacterized protein BU26DRAFT_568938 [Trematosphaeria pertusa]KAF2244957.1 hypothetical protein BU26DRAFT_568938 [Trematosphaeria pertusa]
MAPAGVPQYVLDHAPLVYLYSKDPYHPSSPAATLANTRPQISLKDVLIPSSPLTLSNLDQLNNVGSNSGSDVYLTSHVDITTNPKWLEGVKIDGNGGTAQEKTCVIIVVDKGNGTVDAFYMYFFAFNWGGVVLEKQLGDHVGDWEHNMIRFINGVPKYVWFSQHANGEAFTFSVLKKDKAGKRPLAYCANGSHALFPTPGLHDHTIPNLNLPFKFLLVDETDTGPLYDPLLSAYFYAYNAADRTLTPPDPASPTGFLYFRGRWGDAQYPDSDRRQQELVGNKKYVGGPTGPLDKQLDRKEVWPQNSSSGGQIIRTSLDVDGGRFKQFFGKLNCLGKGKGKQAKGVKRVLVSGEEVRK